MLNSRRMFISGLSSAIVSAISFPFFCSKKAWGADPTDVVFINGKWVPRGEPQPPMAYGYGIPVGELTTDNFNHTRDKILKNTWANQNTKYDLGNIMENDFEWTKRIPGGIGIQEPCYFYDYYNPFDSLKAKIKPTTKQIIFSLTQDGHVKLSY